VILHVSEIVWLTRNPLSIRCPFPSHVIANTAGLEFRTIKVGSPQRISSTPMAYIVRRVMVHETVLNWHEQNAERDRARDFVEEMDTTLAATNYIYVDSE
jgi:hypothetical protein